MASVYLHLISFSAINLFFLRHSDHHMFPFTFYSCSSISCYFAWGFFSWFGFRNALLVFFRTVCLCKTFKRIFHFLVFFVFFFNIINNTQIILSSLASLKCTFLQGFR